MKNGKEEMVEIRWILIKEKDGLKRKMEKIAGMKKRGRVYEIMWDESSP